MLAFEHPLWTNWAFAVGAMHRASAVAAAIVKVLAIVLLFITNLLFRVNRFRWRVLIRPPDTNKESREWRLQRLWRKRHKIAAATLVQMPNCPQCGEEL